LRLLWEGWLELGNVEGSRAKLFTKMDVYAFLIDGGDLMGSSPGLSALAIYVDPIATVEDIVCSSGRLLA
jgi:hypothetical protein